MLLIFMIINIKLISLRLLYLKIEGIMSITIIKFIKVLTNDQTRIQIL